MINIVIAIGILVVIALLRRHPDRPADPPRA